MHCGKTTPGVPGNPIRVTVGQIAGNHRDPCRIHRRSRQNFKTSNGRLKTLATSIRGRLWKVCFLRPRHGSAGSPVICEGPERVSQGSDSKLQNVQRELKNDPHVDSRASLETKVSGPPPPFRRVPRVFQGFRRGLPGRLPWKSLGSHGMFKTGNRCLKMRLARQFLLLRCCLPSISIRLQ